MVGSFLPLPDVTQSKQADINVHTYNDHFGFKSLC